jgi:hypothetical protein
VNGKRIREVIMVANKDGVDASGGPLLAEALTIHLGHFPIET